MQLKTATLEDYFGQQSDSLKTGMKIVAHEMARSIDNCYAEAANAPEMLFKTSDRRK